MIIAVIITVILLIAVAAVYLGGKYMVDFSLNRYRIGRFDKKYLEKSEKPLSAWHEDASPQKKYMLECKSDAEEWLKTVTGEKISLIANDGLKLNALMIRHTDISSHKWIIGVHGYCESHKNMLSRTKILYEAGFDLLLPDLRASGESEGTYIGMGWPDRLDILLWIERICSIDAEAKIILYGVSMGAATVMMTGGENLPQNVRAIIEDSGYSGVADEFGNQIRELFHLPKAFMRLFTPQMKRLAGYSPYEASALEAVKKCRLPMLFIHCKDDNFVPFEMVQRLYACANREKEIFVLPTGGHAGARYANGEDYYKTLFSFINKYL